MIIQISLCIKYIVFFGKNSKEGFYEKAAKEKLIFMQPTARYDRSEMNINKRKYADR